MRGDFPRVEVSPLASVMAAVTCKGTAVSGVGICSVVMSSVYLLLLLLLLLALETGREGLLVFAELLCRGPGLPAFLLDAATAAAAAVVALSHCWGHCRCLFQEHGGCFLDREFWGA